VKRRGFLGLLGMAAAVPLVPPIALASAPACMGLDVAAGPDTTGWVLRRHFVDVTGFGDTNRFYIPSGPAYWERANPAYHVTPARDS
jgi:hypothetical protein